MPAGSGRGLAQAMAFGSYVAACAEVSVDGNKVKINRIVAATNPGYGVNPAQIERQVAGSFVYGLTGLFLGGIEVKDGKVEQENFDTYDMMRIAQMPKVEVTVMPSGRFLGRRRRADDLRRGTCRAQRHHGGNREALPNLPAARAKAWSWRETMPGGGVSRRPIATRMAEIEKK